MYNELIDLVQEFEENKRELNKEQQAYIEKNFRTKLALSYVEGHLCYIFQGKVSAINKLKHFVGLEYEEETVETYIFHDNEALIVYGLSDRLLEFMAELEKLETV